MKESCVSENTIFNETLVSTALTTARTFNTTANIQKKQQKQQINGTQGENKQGDIKQGDNKQGDNKQVDDKRVDHNKHAWNKLRSIEKQRISVENKEILVKYISSEQIQSKIAQITHQIKAIVRAIKFFLTLTVKT